MDESRTEVSPIKGKGFSAAVHTCWCQRAGPAHKTHAGRQRSGTYVNKYSYSLTFRWSRRLKENRTRVSVAQRQLWFKSEEIMETLVRSWCCSSAEKARVCITQVSRGSSGLSTSTCEIFCFLLLPASFCSWKSGRFFSFYRHISFVLCCSKIQLEQKDWSKASEESTIRLHK